MMTRLPGVLPVLARWRLVVRTFSV